MMIKYKMTTLLALFLTSILTMGAVWGNEYEDVVKLQHRWAEINYQLQGKAQLSAFETLLSESDEVVVTYPNAASSWIWRGIIKSTFAGAKGGLGALSLAKSSKLDFEKAISIDPNALEGSAYTSLGTLYFNVPGWPIGFGDDKKAEELLLKALSINPNGIDSNYFFGDYLIQEKRYQEAKIYLIKAMNAPARPNRPLADAGRQKEIAKALAIVTKKLSH